MCVMFAVRCAGSGLCDELITHTEEVYWIFVCVCVCVYVCVCVCVCETKKVNSQTTWNPIGLLRHTQKKN